MLTNRDNRGLDGEEAWIMDDYVYSTYSIHHPWIFRWNLVRFPEYSLHIQIPSAIHIPFILHSTIFVNNVNIAQPVQISHGTAPSAAATAWYSLHSPPTAKASPEDDQVSRRSPGMAGKSKKYTWFRWDLMAFLWDLVYLVGINVDLLGLSWISWDSFWDWTINRDSNTVTIQSSNTASWESLN